MPLPEPSEQEGESVKAGQEPSPESPEPGTDVVPAAPRKPTEFSELVLLTASTENGDGVDSQPKAVHCVLSLEMSGPDTLAGSPQILPVEEQQGAVQPSPQAQELKHSKPDTGEFRASCPCLATFVTLHAQTWASHTPLSSEVTLAIPALL